MTKIALFDYKVDSTTPIGGCNLRLLQHLSGEHEFTVFSVTFENPAPDRITWVRVPAPARPLALLFAAFHLLAPLCYWAHRIRHGKRFDLVQTVEGYSVIGQVAYSHFCHRAYLRRHWKEVGGHRGRRLARWLDHRLRALIEPLIYRRVERVVAPSRGLVRELVDEYPGLAKKIELIPNPVDIERMRRPADFARGQFRDRLKLQAEDTVLAFSALGHFERKGLPLLLEALTRVTDPTVKLLVVGGEADLVSVYQKRVGEMGLRDRVVFVGMQRDVRPYLWAADAFVFPSSYETFSLVSFEAAAAGLPVLATRLHGVEDLLRHGENGYVLEPGVAGVVDGLQALLALSAEERDHLGRQAQVDAAAYRTERFVAAWRVFYQRVLADPEAARRPLAAAAASLAGVATPIDHGGVDANGRSLGEMQG